MQHDARSDVFLTIRGLQKCFSPSISVLTFCHRVESLIYFGLPRERHDDSYTLPIIQRHYCNCHFFSPRLRKSTVQTIIMNPISDPTQNSPASSLPPAIPPLSLSSLKGRGYLSGSERGVGERMDNGLGHGRSTGSYRIRNRIHYGERINLPVVSLHEIPTPEDEHGLHVQRLWSADHLRHQLPCLHRRHRLRAVYQEFNAGLFDYLIATFDSQKREKDETDGGSHSSLMKSKKRAKQKLDSEFGVVRGIDFKNESSARYVSSYL